MCDPVDSDELKYYTCAFAIFLLKSVNLSRHVKKLIPTEKTQIVAQGGCKGRKNTLKIYQYNFG